MVVQQRLLAGSWGQPGGACSSGRACPSAARTYPWARGWVETGGLLRAAARGKQQCLARAAVLQAAWPLDRAVGSCQPHLGV